MTRSVAIVGGGPGGLGLAHELGRAGFEVSLFEAAPELGGLARSFRFGDATIERYYHFLCADDHRYLELLEELDLGVVVRWRHTGMGFYHAGKLYRFGSAFDLLRFDGIGLLGRLRYGLTVLYCSLSSNWRRLDRLYAEEWLLAKLGRQAYDATWLPLLAVKFPGRHQEISAAWVWHRIHRVARSRKTPLHKEQLGHLEGGTQVLVDALEASAAAAGVDLRTSTPVKEIVTEGGKVVGVRTSGGEFLPFDRVVSAVPLPYFLRLTPGLGEIERRRLESIEFIGVVCVVFRLRRPLTPYFWTNVNDPRIPFNGFIEFTNLNPGMTPDGSSIVYVPYYLPRDHERYGLADEELVGECLECLKLVNPELRDDDVIGWVVSRDPYAQPVCRAGFADLVPEAESSIRGLYLIESTQLYPSDRTISGTLDLAKRVAERLIDEMGNTASAERHAKHCQ